jgi:hypothetical protein
MISEDEKPKSLWQRFRLLVYVIVILALGTVALIGSLQMIPGATR